MNIIHCDHLTLNYVGNPVFTDLNWTIGHRDRVGLIGPNGAGKSSLLKLLMGRLEADEGIIRRVPLESGYPITVSYLPQEIDFPDDLTLIESAMILPPELAEAEARLGSIEARLEDPEVYNDMEKLDKVLEEQQVALAQVEHLGGLRHASTVRELLSHFGFTPEDYDLPAASLSGGQKKLVYLTRLATERPDVLLMDEPDNHLDLDSKRRLESFIRNYDGAVVIVSHDRYLLDETVTAIAELENGRLTEYVGNYSAYAQERELRRLRQQQQYVTQQKEIARIEAAIARFELWASMVVDVRHIRQARSRRRMLEKMEANGEMIEQVREARKMGLQFEGWRGSKEALKAIDLAMGFDDDLLFMDVNFLIWHGERVGLIGPNGVGKSVLFNLIRGETEPLSGQVKIGPSTGVGYYAQEHQTLDEWLDRTPLELIRDVRPSSESDAVTVLLKFLFKYDQVRRPIRSLSGGERSRLQLAVLMLQKPNLLLLDEPTNNLDIDSAEVLESALEDFEGSILVISHDRYFLDRVVDRVIVLEDGTSHDFDGNYSDYLESLNSKQPVRA